MQIYVINLKRSPDRRETMRAQLDALGLNYEFFAGVDAMAGEHQRFANYSDEFCLRAWRRPLTPGEVGCFASHYLLWQRCVERDEPMVVMEDDVEVSPRLAEPIQFLPALAGVGYVRLAGVNIPKFRVICRRLPKDWRLARFLQGPLGTQCYVLCPDAAARFIRHAERWILPVDNYMDSFWEHDVPCFGLLPFPIGIPKHISSLIWAEGSPSPSAATRSRVWRPKRFLARKFGDFQRHLKNLEYALS